MSSVREALQSGDKAHLFKISVCDGINLQWLRQRFTANVQRALQTQRWLAESSKQKSTIPGNKLS